MSIWASAIELLNRGTVQHLGETLTLTEAHGAQTVEVRGILTHAGELVRLGHADIAVGQALLTLRQVDAPAWLDRGVTVEIESSGLTFSVTQVLDNSEGLLELTLVQV